jgi:hypothetical protein
MTKPSKARKGYAMHVLSIFITLAILATSGEVMASLISIPTKIDGLITQKRVGKSACGPTALFYALKFGNAEMRQVYSKLQGTTDEEKLRSLMEVHSSKPSKTRFRPTRYDPSDGTSPLDLLATANDLVKGALQSKILHRLPDESEQGGFLKRVHASLRNSLINRVPIVAIVVPYVGKYLDATDVNEWSESNGHYVVITEVPDQIDESQLGFLFKYLDPETGKSNQAYIFEETMREFWGRRDKSDGSAEWIAPEVIVGGKEVASPYLNLTAPALKLNPKNAKHAQRVVLTLATVIGNFTAETL